MPKANLPLPMGFYTHQSLPLSSQRCINWIPTVMQGGALAPTALIHRPGLVQFADTGLGACRGGVDFNGVPHFVYGTSLVSVSSTGVVTNHGTIPGTVRVQFAYNSTKDAASVMVVLVPGGNAYVWDSTTLTQITDVDFQVSDSVVYKDGYFVFTATDGDQLFVSNLNQPLVYDGLDYGAAERSPDKIVSVIDTNDELSVLGERTTEVFTDIGGADFPFQAIPGAFTEKGVHSKYGAIKFDNTYVFIGGGFNEKSSIWRQTSSNNAAKISTDAIDHEIQKFSKEEIAQAFAMTYSEDGQIFAIFTFNSDVIPGRTFVYNGTASALAGSQVWFELQSGVVESHWRVNAIVKAYGKLLVGDDVDGRIGYLDSETYTEYGDTISWQAAFQPFSQNGTELFAGELEATFESGVGLTSGQGSNPVIRMDFSDDGGRTWSSEFSRSIGKIGAYGQRSTWNRQGSFPVARTIRFTGTDPVKYNLIKVASDIEIGAQ